MGLALLIDDDLPLLESIRRAANLNELAFETAATWDEGLGLFHVLAPSVVIADYHMPNSRNGLQLLAEIKRLRPSVRVVLVSAYINDEDVERVEALNVVDRALRKMDLTTVETILDEIRLANESDHELTDWVAFANARVRAAQASGEELDRLDEFFKTNRAP
ncbi:MAG: response regulator [Chloroflexi bacterium]|nr:response regulator [Chloroflexota bacterium]